MPKRQKSSTVGPHHLLQQRAAALPQLGAERVLVTAAETGHHLLQVHCQVQRRLVDRKVFVAGHRESPGWVPIVRLSACRPRCPPIRRCRSSDSRPPSQGCEGRWDGTAEAGIGRGDSPPSPIRKSVTWSRLSSAHAQIVKKWVRATCGDWSASPVRTSISPCVNERRAEANGSNRGQSAAESPKAGQRSRRLQLEPTTVHTSG